MMHEWEADPAELCYCRVCESVVVDPTRHATLCHWCLLAGYKTRACGCLTQHARMMEPCSRAHRMCETCHEQPPQARDTVCGPCRFAAEQQADPEQAEWYARR